ncbi:hypothetical protein MBLNU459_g3414t1 [Dothideomycetes sp. NU459]
MASTCGVCQAQPPKYKCPSCNVRYCSIPCFKSHKDSHAQHVDVQEEKPDQSATIPVAPAVRTSTTTTTNNNSNKKPDFAGFEDDPDLARLMARYPGLRIQLQSVYGLTLEPPPQDRHDRPHFQRGRGGRGRGAWRGRGRPYPEHQQQLPRASNWTQAKGDKEAQESFRKMRDAEGEGEGGGGAGLAEFVQLLKIKYRADDDGLT